MQALHVHKERPGTCIYRNLAFIGWHLNIFCPSGTKNKKLQERYYLGLLHFFQQAIHLLQHTSTVLTVETFSLTVAYTVLL